MAHFARLDENNVVLQVIVVNNEVLNNLPFPESEAIGIEFCQSHFGGNWKQTSYNGNFRVNYAGIGFTYNEINDVFYAPQPFPSFVLNNQTWQWDSPIPRPNDGKFYRWDEDTISWIEVP